MNHTNSLQKLLNFLDDLKQYKIYHRLECNRQEALMVQVAIPGERWEVEFFADGTVEVEIFRSTENGVVSGSDAEAALEHLLTNFAG